MVRSVARVTDPMDDRGQPARSSRPRFTAEMRGLDGGTPQLGRAEDRRGHEGTIAYRAVAAVARVPGLRSVLGAVPPRPGGRASGLAGDPDALVASPLYERLLRIRASDRYARLVRAPVRRLRGRPVAPAPAAAPALPAPPAAPSSEIRLGPWASRRTDDALAFLRRVPFDELQRRGWHLQPNHFYVPLNDVAFLRANPQLWHDRGLPQGRRLGPRRPARGRAHGRAPPGRARRRVLRAAAGARRSTSGTTARSAAPTRSSTTASSATGARAASSRSARAGRACCSPARSSATGPRRRAPSRSSSRSPTSRSSPGCRASGRSTARSSSTPTSGSSSVCRRATSASTTARTACAPAATSTGSCSR